MDPGEQKTTAETLCYGQAWVTSYFCDAVSQINLQIAVGTRDKMVQVLTLNASLQLQSVFAVQLENTVPKSVAFTDNQDIYVFRLYDGNFMKLKDEDGGIVQEISCKSVFGHAAVHSKQGVFIVDNATDSFTLYRLEGNDTDAGLVQTISMRDLHGCCTIASTSTVLGHGKTTIKIWAYEYAVQKVSKAPSENYWSLLCILMMLTQLLALLSMSVFLLVNYKDSLLDSAVNHVHGYMTLAMMINVANNFSQHVKVAMMFDEYVNIEKESPTKGYIKNDIRMLQELADKLIELAQEAVEGMTVGKSGGVDKGWSKGSQSAKGMELVRWMVLPCRRHNRWENNELNELDSVNQRIAVGSKSGGVDRTLGGAKDRNQRKGWNWRGRWYSHAGDTTVHTVVLWGWGMMSSMSSTVQTVELVVGSDEGSMGMTAQRSTFIAPRLDIEVAVTFHDLFPGHDFIDYGFNILSLDSHTRSLCCILIIGLPIAEITCKLHRPMKFNILALVFHGTAYHRNNLGRNCTEETTWVETAPKAQKLHQEVVLMFSFLT
ncbi:hypothetical protein DFJ58DRAFT_847795 [Suillus subalutaceus]|uniref:uncharacterized protein n=1 Tax=Suillus subalutaceus TaxID=48586 RepID=UPI001B86D900|nr:uncharacterized protein DFJ58DRAFT_847795 [Suillus subalutaceus]KAG1833609.1 hypothetical protein DFJ58DRAFT_847795 [Suillus subalutaceus]